MNIMSSNSSNSSIEIVSMNANTVASKEELSKKLRQDILAFIAQRNGKVTHVPAGASGYEWKELSTCKRKGKPA